MSTLTTDHPVFVRARAAARARPEFRVSRPALPVTRLSNAPVRMPADRVARPGALIAHGEPVPVEMPGTALPPPEEAPHEIEEMPPANVPLPTHEPPGMPAPAA